MTDINKLLKKYDIEDSKSFAILHKAEKYSDYDPEYMANVLSDIKKSVPDKFTIIQDLLINAYRKTAKP